MSNLTKIEHDELRNRLNPVVKDEFVSPLKLSSTKTELKIRLDDIAHLKELEKLEDDYLNY